MPGEPKRVRPSKSRADTTGTPPPVGLGLPDPDVKAGGAVARLIYTAMASLDGYVEDAGGGFGWSAPDEQVHAFINDAERSVGTYLCGRRLYATMLPWQTVDPAGDGPQVVREYAAIWQAADKVVFSRTLASVSGPRTRLERTFDRERVAALKASTDRDLSVGGAQLAAQALRDGLVDEVRLLLHPVTVGAGKAALPGGVRLRLLDEQHFDSGVVHLRYAVRP
ncbi:MAG TPA: dihydrofolate reductase family protein [Kineosporiaceae bacterium]|nr:dihydrofolate reductase family protein [Kineosporiaceae bacterium]